MLALAAPAMLGATTPRVTIGTPPTAPEANGTTVKPRTQLLEMALESLNGTVAHRMRLDGTVGLTFRQPDSRLNVSMSDDFAAIMQIASPTSATLSLADGSIGKIMSAITVNGTGFVADDFSPYVRLSKSDARMLQTWIAPRDQQIRPTTLAGLTNIREVAGAAPGTVHFRADLSANYMQTLIRVLTVDPTRPDSGPDIPGMFTYAPGTLDAVATADGKLVSESIATEATLRSGQTGLIWELFEKRVGWAKLSVQATFTPYDLGANVQVITPYVAPVDQRMAGDIQSLSLLIGGGMAADTYARVVGDYGGMTIRNLQRIEPAITFIKRGVARAAKNQVKLVRVAKRRVVMSTLSPQKRMFTLDLPLVGDPIITCRTTKGKECQIGVFAKIAARLSTATTAAVQRRTTRPR